jgi:hypothetical protein
MSDPECPYCFAPLPEGMRHSCVPLRGRVHPTNAFYFNDNGESRLVRLHKDATLPKNAPPRLAIDRYPRPWDSSEPLGQICAAMEAAGLPHAFGKEAATVAIEYDGVGDLMRAWADAMEDADRRMAIVLEIDQLIADLQTARPHEWQPYSDRPLLPMARKTLRPFSRMPLRRTVDQTRLARSLTTGKPSTVNLLPRNWPVRQKN